jgi:hypothetical protein
MNELEARQTEEVALEGKLDRRLDNGAYVLMTVEPTDRERGGVFARYETERPTAIATVADLDLFVARVRDQILSFMEDLKKGYKGHGDVIKIDVDILYSGD